MKRYKAVFINTSQVRDTKHFKFFTALSIFDAETLAIPYAHGIGQMQLHGLYEV